MQALVDRFYEVLGDGRLDTAEVPRFVKILMELAASLQVSGAEKRALVVAAMVRIYEKETGNAVPEYVLYMLTPLVNQLYELGGPVVFGAAKSAGQSVGRRLCRCLR